MDPNQVQGNGSQDPKAEETKQPAPVPSADQVSTEEIKAPATEGGEVSDDLSLPADASERTKQQFEKLKARNRELEQKVAGTNPPSDPVDNSEFGNSVFDSFHAPQVPEQNIPTQGFSHLNQTQVEAISQQFVDEEGNVDVYRLNQALAEANQRAALAERRTVSVEERLQRFEESQQAREAHAVFPELDPHSQKFDKDFFNAVRDRILREKHYEGKDITLLDAANAVSKKFNRTTDSQVKTQAVEEYKQSQQARNQGPLEQGKGETRNTVANLDELRERTRRGDPAAIAERLKNLGI